MKLITSTRRATLLSLLYGGILLAGGAGCTRGTLTAPTAIAPQTARLTGTAVSHSVQDLVVQRDGTLTATLTWMYSNNVDITLTEHTCGTRDFYGCTILASSTSPRGVDSERVVRTVRAGMTLRFWILNLDDTTGAPYTLDVTVQ
jgi:hypothetical protein